MPGLLGIASNRGGSVVGQGFPAMLTAMARGGRLRAESLRDARCRRCVVACARGAGLPAHPRPSLRPQAVADRLKFAFPRGDKTLASGVDLGPAGSLLTYRASTGNGTIESYASLADLFAQTNIS